MQCDMGATVPAATRSSGASRIVRHVFTRPGASHFPGTPPTCLVTRPPLISRARIRIVAAHGGVVAVRVLRAIPGRVVAWVTVTETVTEVVAKENAAKAEYGAAPESTELPIKARIEVATCEGTPTAE